MENGFVYLFVYFLCFESCGCAMFDEPRCSKYDFEEKVLEKVVRFEHKMEIMTETLKEFSTQMKDEINELKVDWTETNERFQADWTEIKNGFELMKYEVMEREKMLNDTIHTTMQRLAAKIPQSYYAFSAYDLSGYKPSVGSTLVFTKTLVNEGGVYSTATGKFTAPCDGVYEFHATVAPKYGDKEVRVEFKAGGTVIGAFNVVAKSYWVTNSGSGTMRLRKGTQVYLRVADVHSGFTFREDNHAMNVFSGHLISK